MVLSPQQQTTRMLTQAMDYQTASLQAKLGYTPNMNQLVTLDTVKNAMSRLTLEDLQNIITPVLFDKIFKTEFTTFESNNPYAVFYSDTTEYGRTKEHILSISGSMVNLAGQTAGDFNNNIIDGKMVGKDENPSTLDYFASEDIVYYTNHKRAFVILASINFTELKGAFNSQGAWDSFTSRKTQMLMEQAREEESAVISQHLASLLIPQNVPMIDDTVLKTSPKLTLLGDGFTQAELVQTLQTYVNAIKFPSLAKQQNPLGLPLITAPENMVAFITPDLLTSQNFLEAYAFTANKVTLPTTTEMFAPLPPVAIAGLPVDVIGTVAGVTNGTYTGDVLPIAFISDNKVLDVIHSQLYTDTETNKLMEFFTAQVHDHMHVHPSYEKNIRFFALPLNTMGTLLDPVITIVGATDGVTADGSITVPTTTLDANGATVTITNVITDPTGATVATPTTLLAGDYLVTIKASGYNDLFLDVVVPIK